MKIYVPDPNKEGSLMPLPESSTHCKRPRVAKAINLLEQALQDIGTGLVLTALLLVVLLIAL